MPNVATKKYKVRLRNEQTPLPCSITTRDDGVIKATLIPNQWTEVPLAIYDMLKRKFQLKADVTRMVPDFHANERNPRSKQEGGETIMREEEKRGYIIEFM